MKNGPDYIQFYPTVRCDRRCTFCFNRSLSQHADMQLDAFERLLARFPRSVRTIDIMGGEPTLHPQIVEMIRTALSSGLSVNVSSNGARPEVLQEIRDLGDRVTLGISVNDKRTFENLREFIRTTSPVVKTVHTRSLDVSLIEEVLSLAPERFYLIYRDAVDMSDLAETVPFAVFLEECARFHPTAPGSVFCSGFLPDTGQYPELARVRCPAGTTKLGVMSDGTTYPCNLFFGRKEFRLGNMLTDPFQELWNHKALSFFRTYGTNRCTRQSCPVHATCHGGCPAQSLVLAGDLGAPDPRCSLIGGERENLLY